MQINLISIGNKMPLWVKQGYHEYAKRLPKECELILKEIAPGNRGKNTDIIRLTKEEGRRIIAAIPTRAHVVIMDIGGAHWSSQEIAQAMTRWLNNGQNIALLVGGPEGLDDAVRSLAQESWSLSKLTFPHPLVRIVIAEQIYRAWSMLRNHPYHR